MPFARRLAHLLALAAGTYVGLTVLGGAALYTAATVWIGPALVGGLLAALPQAGPVTRTGLRGKIPWPVVNAAAWLAWAAVIRVVAGALVGAVQPVRVTPGELAAIALPSLAAGALVLALCFGLGTARRWAFATTLAAAYFGASVAIVAFTRAGLPFTGIGAGTLVLTAAFAAAIDRAAPVRTPQGTTTSE